MNDAKRTGLTVIVGVLALLIFTLGSWAWLYGTAEIRGRVGAEVKLESADSRIANYDHFFDLCAAVQGYEHALLSQRSALAAGINADRTYANMAGITAQRARAIAQYNADANKSYTKARFLGDTLPRRLDVNLENTQCN